MLKKCRECGNEVSSEAKTCPSCGIKSPAQRHIGCIPSLAVIVFAIFAIGYCASPSPTTKTPALATPPTTSTADDKANTPTEPKTPKAERTLWFYNTTEEGMGRGKIKKATIIATNSLQFGFPYQGEQWPHLVLRSHPKHGKDVIVNIDHGQFLCGYDDCHVYVRFDNGKPQKFSASGPSDHSTATLFISDFARFMKGVRKADKTYIEAEFYNNGQRVMEFNTAGLKWE